MKIRSKKSFLTLLFGGLLVTTITFSICNILNDSQTSNLINSGTSIKNETSTKNNSIVPTFGDDNKNQSNITPNGILNIHNGVINLTLYNNILAWSFDVMNSDFMLNLNTQKTKPSSITNLGVKYNTYTKTTVFVYGIAHYENNGNEQTTQQEISFLFQINLSSGTPYLLNNSYSSSILTSEKNSDALKNSIDWVVLNQNDGTFFVFSKNQNTAIKTIVKFSSINYSSVNIDSSNLVSVLEGNKLINVANLYGNYFALSSVSNQATNSTHNVDFYIFDFNLTQLTAKQTIQSTNDVENMIGEPLTFISSNNSIITVVLPFVTDGFSNNIDLTKKINIFRFSPNESDTSNNGKKKIEKSQIEIGKSEDTNNSGTVSNGYAYAYRIDEKNKKLFVTTIDTSNSQKLYCYKFDDSTGKYSTVYEITNFTSSSLQSKIENKKINNFFILNGNNMDTNSYLIREELTYLNGQKDSLSNVNYFKGKITDSNSTISLTEISPLDSYSLKDISTSIKEENLDKHLPSDLKEEDLTKMVKLVNSSGIEIENITKKLSPSSPNQFNDVNGSINVIIEYSVKNWWNQNSSTVFNYPINASGFYTRNSLSFKLVKSENDDATKWNEINSLKHKLPSKITKEEIMKSFYVAGSNLKISEKDIIITNSSSTSSTSLNNTRIESNDENKSSPIEVIANDDDGTIAINYNLTALSSPNMPVDNVIGSYKYNGFLRVGGWDQVTLNTNVFNSLKKSRLAYQISKKEIIESLNLSSYYSRNESDWELTINNVDQSSNEFIENIINGKMSFTIKYKATENGIPSTIPSSNYTVSVGNEENNNGSGFITLPEYVGTKIELDNTRLNELTSSMNIENIESNINNLIGDYSTSKNNWLDVSRQFNFTLKKEESTETKLLFSGTPNTQITSNIDIILNSGKTKLILNSIFQTKLLEKQPNLFDDIKSINVNANITVYDWNYGISNSSNIISYKDLYNESSPEKIKYYYLLPSSFVELFANDQQKGKIAFQDTFNLLKEYSKINESGEIDKNDVTYYEIKYVQLIPDNESGSVIVNYTVEYPNIRNSSGFTVTTNPQIVISGFKTTTQVKGDFNVIILSAVAALVVLAIFTIIIMRVKRNKFVNANKNNGIKYSKIKKIK